MQPAVLRRGQVAVQIRRVREHLGQGGLTHATDAESHTIGRFHAARMRCSQSFRSIMAANITHGALDVQYGVQMVAPTPPELA